MTFEIILAAFGTSALWSLWTYFITRKQIEPNATLIKIAADANEAMRNMSNTVADTTASATGVLMRTVETQNESIRAQDARMAQMAELVTTTDESAVAERIANLAVKSIRDVHMVQATGRVVAQVEPVVGEVPESEEEVLPGLIPAKDID